MGQKLLQNREILRGAEAAAKWGFCVGQKLVQNGGFCVGQKLLQNGGFLRGAEAGAACPLSSLPQELR